MKKYAVVVAGGSGVRMNTTLPKQFHLLQGRPVLWYTLTAFLSAFDDLEIILVLPEKYIDEGKKLLAEMTDGQRVRIQAGGDTRFHSVRNGLQLVADPSVVFVHDGVRCLVSAALIQRCYSAAIENGNAIPATVATDSMRLTTIDGNRVIDRTSLYHIQTPQTFQSAQLLGAFRQPWQEHFTDEASVVEASGIAINLVEGERENIKLTTPLDLVIADCLLRQRES